MGAGDAVHQHEAQAVLLAVGAGGAAGGAGARGKLLGRGSRAVVGHADRGEPLARRKRHRHVAAALVVQARVGDGVLHGARDQALVAQHHGLGSALGHLEVEGVQLVEARVHVPRHHRAQKARQGHTLQLERLHVVVKLGGGVEVGDEVLDLESLRADEGRLGARVLRHPFVGRQRVSVAEDHRQRRADVVRHAADPVRARGVLLLDDARCLGDLVADLAQVALEAQLGGASFRERVERVGDGADRPLRAPPRRRVHREQDPQVDGEHEQQVERDHAHGGRGEREAHVPVRALREAHREQAVVAVPEEGRVVGDVGVVRGHGHLVGGEGRGDVVRRSVRPGHRALAVHEDRPRAVGVELRSPRLAELPALLAARECAVHGARHRGGRAVVEVLVGLVVGDDRVQEEVHHHDEEGERGEQQQLLREEQREAGGPLPAPSARPARHAHPRLTSL